MSKVSIIIYVSVAVILLFIVSHSPKTKSSHSRHRRLTLRSNFSFADDPKHHHQPISFDPLVADIEGKREDKQWEKSRFEFDEASAAESPEWKDFVDAEDYLNDEEKFNVTNRIMLLFPIIDVDPMDGYVSEHELTEWNLMQLEKEVMHRTEREMETHDKNHDGFVSFAEYEPPSWTHNSDSSVCNMGWWKEEHFNASDADGDGLLNITEFNNFLHPADSRSSKLLNWLCNEEIRERDSDKDGKLSFKEFFHGLFDLVRDYEEEVHNFSHESTNDFLESSARKMFDELDNDGDGYLSAAELLPVIGKLHPSEHYYAKQQAEYVIQQADADKDGRLTLSEMIENPYAFYSAIFNDDEDEENDFHDEFR